MKQAVRLRASMTVELTLLMPFIIGVFLFLFFTSYYLHDVCAIQKGCATSLIRGSLIRDDREAKASMEEALEEIRLLGKWDLEKGVRLDGKNIKVQMRGNMDVREGLFLKLIRGHYEYGTEQQTERIDETAYIRKHR